MTAAAEAPLTLTNEDIEKIASESANLAKYAHELEGKVASLEAAKKDLELKLQDAEKRAQEAGRQEKVLLEKVAHYDPNKSMRELVMGAIGFLKESGTIQESTREKLASQVAAKGGDPAGVFNQILSKLVDVVNESPSSGQAFRKQAASIQTHRPADPHGDFAFLEEATA